MSVARGRARDRAPVKPSADALSAPQRRYRAALAANLAKNTGRTLTQWLALARRCPQGGPRARLRWFKETHGLGQNYAMHVLGQLESASDRAARAPRRLRAALWSEPAAARTLVALEAAVARFPELVRGQRKAYTMWSRSFAFAAARPWRGAVRLGLALDPSADTHLAGVQREGWSERLKSTLVLADARAVNRRVRRLLRAAWQRS